MKQCLLLSLLLAGCANSLYNSPPEKEQFLQRYFEEAQKGEDTVRFWCKESERFGRAMTGVKAYQIRVAIPDSTDPRDTLYTIRIESDRKGEKPVSQQWLFVVRQAQGQQPCLYLLTEMPK